MWCNVVIAWKLGPCMCGLWVNVWTVQINNNNNNNKFAQSNLGRGPHRGTVAHVHRKVPIGYSGSPEIRPQKDPFPWTDCQTPLPVSCLDPSDLWCQTASESDLLFFHNALDRPMHGHTNRQIIHGKVWERLGLIIVIIIIIIIHTVGSLA